MSENTNDNLGQVAVSGTDVSPEATTTTQPQAGSEATTTPVESTSTSTEQPILGKFKTQDDLIKSYQELESKQPEYAQARRRSEMLEKLAAQNGTSVEELERQMEETLEKQEMEAAGVNDPIVFKMQKKLEALEADSKKMHFENEFSQLQKQYPVLQNVKDSIKQTFLNSPGRTLTQIVNDLYVPVLSQVEQQAVAKLSQKEAANALSPNGNVQHVVSEQELERLRKAAKATGSIEAITAYTTAKKMLKQ